MEFIARPRIGRPVTWSQFLLGRPGPGGSPGADWRAMVDGTSASQERAGHWLDGRPLPSPVLYPGSIERTSIAERHEPKGYMTLEVLPGDDGGRLDRWTFHELPTRPMIDLEIDGEGLDGPRLARLLRRSLGRLDPDAVVRLTVRGRLEPQAAETLRAASLRSLVPATMTVSLRPAGRRDAPSGPSLRRGT